MPKTIDFSDYRSRFSLYSDSIEQGGMNIMSRTFDESGNYDDIITIPITLDQLYLKTLVTDSLIELKNENTELENVTIDLVDLYNQVPVDSLYPTILAQSQYSSINQGLFLKSTTSEILVNGDFSENDFGVVGRPFVWAPNDPRMQHIIYGRRSKEPMNWYNVDGNGCVGITLDFDGIYGVGQTFPAKPGDLITFNAQIRSNGKPGINNSVYIWAFNTNGNIIKIAGVKSNPSIDWSTTRTVVLTMPDNTAYCSVSLFGGDNRKTCFILIDNFNVNGITDADGDGVEDALDDYPNDPERAYNYYFPMNLIMAPLLLKINGQIEVIMISMIS